jgi:hypothetical protein
VIVARYSIKNYGFAGEKLFNKCKLLYADKPVLLNENIKAISNSS